MTINKMEIAALSDRNPAAEALLQYASNRERNIRRGVSSFQFLKSQISKQVNVSDQEFLSAVRSLDALGIGKIIGPDEFQWTMPIIQLGQIYKSMQAQEPLRPRPGLTTANPDPIKPTKIVMVVGIGKEVEVEYTPNLSRKEIDFLISMLQERLLRSCAA